ncbi:glutamate 5-kinase [Ligilactobacillus murinus]|uniref:glutamate 5-kinase n=1 Tax=Ligilactobacillus murinus TaxID=1622 RepID=UPI0010717E5A|nr:glutamate 5-kinase [Ligilactobacillus murinus]MBF0758930.1 glutamate 5-kinase [Ligilactobacillus murinus]MBF0833079.1 glutamate 5-kinase [Ligilactobacillus murinus]TFU63458.1 glutamate 5-kinase [Ligilactobacillus murinus]
MVKKRQLDAKRIVVKVGTSTLIHPNGKVNFHAIDQLCYVLTGLVNDGKQVVLVSSGAIGVGMGQVGLHERPESIPAQQALAAIGQSGLMSVYQQRFSLYGQRIGQILLTHDVLEYPLSRKNALNTFNSLLEWGVIPIVNENDTVAVDEMDHHTKFGDNDQLSAIVSSIVDADLLVMLSDIDGFFDKNPRKYADAKLFERITKIDETAIEAAGGKGSKFGTGGMMTKLKAAKRMLENDKMMILANGQDPAIIFELIKGEPLGTLFVKEEK